MAVCDFRLSAIGDPVARCTRTHRHPLFRRASGCRTTYRPTRPTAGFPPVRPAALLCRLEFHYTPEPAGRLNKGRIEIGVLHALWPAPAESTILSRLISEIFAWEQRCNAAGASVKWIFTTEKACAKIEPLTCRERRRISDVGPRSSAPSAGSLPLPKTSEPQSVNPDVVKLLASRRVRRAAIAARWIVGPDPIAPAINSSFLA